MKKEIYRNNEISIKKGLISLFLTLEQYLKKQIELGRIVKVAVLLIKSGVNKNNSIFQTIAKRCLNEQKDDGGWIDVEDSLWCIAFLKEFKKYFKEYKHGLDWLNKQKNINGGWGKT